MHRGVLHSTCRLLLESLGSADVLAETGWQKMFVLVGFFCFCFSLQVLAVHGVSLFLILFGLLIGASCTVAVLHGLKLV